MSEGQELSDLLDDGSRRCLNCGADDYQCDCEECVECGDTSECCEWMDEVNGFVCDQCAPEVMA